VFCLKLFVILAVCVVVFPLFLRETPLQPQRKFLKNRMETWLVSELQKSKGHHECSRSTDKFGWSKAETTYAVLSHYENLYDEELLKEVLEQVLKTSDKIDRHMGIISTTEPAIKSSSCEKDEKVIKGMKDATAKLLRKMEGAKICDNYLFDKLGEETDERMLFSIKDVKDRLYEERYTRLSEPDFGRFFDKMIADVRSDQSLHADLKTSGLTDIRTNLSPHYTLICSVHLWIWRKRFYFGVAVFILAVIMGLFYKFKRSSQVKVEAEEIFKQVMSHLQNKSRSVNSWVPVQYCRELLFEEGNPEVWAEVEKMVAKTSKVLKGVEQVDGMDQKCWKVRMHLD